MSITSESIEASEYPACCQRFKTQKGLLYLSAIRELFDNGIAVPAGNAGKLYDRYRLSGLSLTRKHMMTLKQASQKWGITPRMINYRCVNGRIPGAEKSAAVWLIPQDAQKPAGGRRKQRR